MERSILQLAEPCIRFATRRADVPIGGSKIGGAPDLPPEAEWPTNPETLTFLAQIDLTEISRLMPSPLPQDGLLAFFFDRTALDEGEKACRVVHARGNLTRRRLPDGHETIHECAMDFTVGTSFPGLGSPFIELLGPMSDVEAERFASLDLRRRVGDTGSNHQLLGYPAGIQGDVMIQRAAHDRRFASWSAAERRAEARRYRQLLALDTDDNADLRWVDMGTCWFLVSATDLERHELSRATSVIQFC
ncbi:MAG TPA: YwqG family protein [Kofleriaceae bacterium]